MVANPIYLKGGKLWLTTRNPSVLSADGTQSELFMACLALMTLKELNLKLSPRHNQSYTKAFLAGEPITKVNRILKSTAQISILWETLLANDAIEVDNLDKTKYKSSELRSKKMAEKRDFPSPACNLPTRRRRCKGNRCG